MKWMSMKKYLQMYVKDVESAQTAYLSPIESEELSGLPDTYIEVAEYDCLRDEGIAYGELLQQNGVKVEIHETFGAMHGYDIAEKSGLLMECEKNRVQFLKMTLQ